MLERILCFGHLDDVTRLVLVELLFELGMGSFERDSLVVSLLEQALQTTHFLDEASLDLVDEVRVGLGLTSGGVAAASICLPLVCCQRPRRATCRASLWRLADSIGDARSF